MYYIIESYKDYNYSTGKIEVNYIIAKSVDNRKGNPINYGSGNATYREIETRDLFYRYDTLEAAKAEIKERKNRQDCPYDCKQCYPEVYRPTED